MRLRLLVPVAALSALALPGVAQAKTTYPSIVKVSPLSLGVGDTLTVKGHGFRAGKGRNTVVFQRAGGRAVFVKAGKSTRTTISVLIPAKLLSQMAQKAGTPVATTFRVRILAARFGKRFTTLKASPRIGPVGTQAKGTAADCDGDGVPNTKDTDDDNDLLPDTLEASIGTDSCKADTDGDGMSDGWEYESALDDNGHALPSPKKRPYPNALDPSDAAVDSDGDGLTNLDEYQAWASFGGHKFPLSYSGGDPASGGKIAPTADQKWWDRDDNGFLSDNERDADGDGIPNQDEGGLDKLPAKIDVVGYLSDTYIEDPEVRALIDVVPLYGPLDYVHKVQGTNWLDNDSDGDTIPDGADDQDGDGISNLDEIQVDVATKDKLEHVINPCVPDLDARLCILGDDDIDNDGIPNRLDDDDDGDLLPDTLERQIGTNPYKADTDEDGISDGYEYFAAKDLNGSALPYPQKEPYPNALDKSDANIDFDGDGLTLSDEYKAWKFTGSNPPPLSYSDGNQFSQGTKLPDGQKDADGDGLANLVELHGPLSDSSYWPTVSKGTCSPNYTESPYPGPKYSGLDFVDPDTDGDGILDGADDIDHDGYTNAQEESRPAGWCNTYVSVGPALFGNPNMSSGFDDRGSATGTHKDTSARVDAFNPCKPVYSAACHVYPPAGYYVANTTYTEDWEGANP